MEELISTKKVLYVDMDNVLVDFPSGKARLSPEDHRKYKDNPDEAPGIFALMDPIDGAVDAYKKLSQVFETYILSTAPWKNPSAWSDKLLWVQKHFGVEDGTPAYKRLILSHHKHLNQARSSSMTASTTAFTNSQGIHIRFGSERFPDWPTVTAELLRIAGSGA